MNESESRSPLRWLMLAVFLVMPIVNFSAPLWPGGAGRVMDDVSTRIDAAGYAFSIWFVIFVGMIFFCVQVIRAEPPTRPLRAAMGWLILAGVASTAFVPISIYGNSVLGWIDIVAHLIPLVFANLALRKHVRISKRPDTSRWSFFAPSMYLGWISAAFLIITAMAAHELGIQFENEFTTAMTCSIVGAIATVALLVLRTGDLVFAGTIAWALIAVGVKQSAYPPIRFTAWGAAGLIGLATMLTVTLGNRCCPNKEQVGIAAVTLSAK